MFLLPVPMLAGILLAWVLGGSPAGLAQARVCWWPLALASLALQLGLHNPPIDRQPWALQWGPAVWMLALGIMLVALLRNTFRAAEHPWPWRVAALGVALNLTVVVANGGYMPQAPDARLAAGRGAPIATELHNTSPATPDTRLGLLGDLIPEPAWLPGANVLSLGDLLLALGLGWWAFAVTRAAVPRSSIGVATAGHSTA